MSFNDWLNKMDGRNSRLERAYDELVLDRYNDNNTFWKTVLCWLKLVYSCAYDEGKKESENIVDSLQNEIKLQRKEIAVLREERRLIVAQDKVPEIGWKE